MKKFLTIILTLVLIIVPTGSAFATSEIDLKVDLEQDFIEISDELIKVVDEHIDLKGKSYKIVNQKELKDKISKQEFAIVKDKLKETNEILKSSDKFEKQSDNTFLFEISDEEVQKKAKEAGYDFDLNAEADQIYTEGQPTIASAWDYNGYNRLYLEWWGVEIWLSKTVVSNISGGTITAGAILLGIIIPGVGWAIAIGVSTWVIGMYASYNAKPIVMGVQWNGIIRYTYIQTP